jgi:hypothetical protein
MGLDVRDYRIIKSDNQTRYKSDKIECFLSPINQARSVLDSRFWHLYKEHI